jgi:flagellar hook-associated protein 2
LNTNYQDVVNFLQPGNGYTSFGDNFTTTLNNLGNTEPDGVISLALQSDQATESTLNTDITNENATISTEQSQLTTELNEANFTLEEIPQQIQSINEIYSAVTGYDENLSG